MPPSGTIPRGRRLRLPEIFDIWIEKQKVRRFFPGRSGASTEAFTTFCGDLSTPKLSTIAEAARLPRHKPAINCPYGLLI